MIKDNKRKNFRKRRKGKREKPEFDQKILDLARVTRVVKGGRRFSFRATVVIGNRKGKVGVGVAKGADTPNAISKAVSDAKKDLINIKRTNTSIGFEVVKKVGAARVMIKPAKEGTGIVAGGAMRSVLELAGVKDIVGKALSRTTNKINVARATISALEELGKPLVGAEKIRAKEAAAENNNEKKGEKAEDKVEDKKEEKKS